MDRKIRKNSIILFEHPTSTTTTTVCRAKVPKMLFLLDVIFSYRLLFYIINKSELFYQLYQGNEKSVNVNYSKALEILLQMSHHLFFYSIFLLQKKFQSSKGEISQTSFAYVE